MGGAIIAPLRSPIRRLPPAEMAIAESYPHSLQNFPYAAGRNSVQTGHSSDIMGLSSKTINSSGANFQSGCNPYMISSMLPAAYYGRVSVRPCI